MNDGYTCVLCSRVLAPRSRYAEIVNAVAALASSLRIGDPLDRFTDIGPMATSELRPKVEGYVAKGKTEARLVAGDGRPKGLDRGTFVEPTVFAAVSNAATIAQVEIFGRVLSVIPYDDDADAVRVADNSIYGLDGTVFSSDPERAKRIARRVQTGTIGIGYPGAIGSPFGGVKASGLGREFGPEALSSYQQFKSLCVSA